MKLICIGRNYAEHAKELNNEIPDKPVIFMKPETAVIRAGYHFYIPDFSNDVHHEIELVLKICKNGKNIQAKFADAYFEEIGIGIDFTARDLQAECKAKGLPWERAKAFDGSAPVGMFLKKESIGYPGDIAFSLKKNGVLVQSGNTADLLFNFNKIIAEISTFITLKKGDLIFTGTPAGVGPVAAGDFLEGFIGEQKCLALHVK